MQHNSGAAQTQQPAVRWVWIMLALLSLQACQRQTSIKPVQTMDVLNLSQADDYHFQGKMSFSDGQEGGSGQVQWHQQGGLISARLRAPIGGKSWQITESLTGAEVVTSEGDVIYGETAAQLVSEQLGWEVPWLALRDWVIGQVHNPEQARLQWQSGGYVIMEQGWQITYSKLNDYPEGLLPHKMIARKGDHSIKLVIRKWRW